jgi:hypothetical protein
MIKEYFASYFAGRDACATLLNVAQRRDIGNKNGWQRFKGALQCWISPGAGISGRLGCEKLWSLKARHFGGSGNPCQNNRIDNHYKLFETHFLSLMTNKEYTFYI